MAEEEKFLAHSDFIKEKFKEEYREADLEKIIVKCCFLDESYRNTIVNGSPSFGLRINMTSTFQISLMKLIEEIKEEEIKEEILFIGLFNPFDKISDFLEEQDFINNEIIKVLNEKFSEIYVYDEHYTFEKLK